MIARWMAALAVAAALAGPAQVHAERPGRLQTFPPYLYLLPAPAICAIGRESAQP
jgi:hypothetical protein